MLTFFRGEPAAPRVGELIATQPTLMSSINLGEVLYWTVRERGRPAADDVVDKLRSAVMVEDPDWHLVHAAAQVKARGGLSYADAFCVATAQRHDALLYTGDPEILALHHLVDVVDLRSSATS